MKPCVSHAQNLKTILRAARNGDLALVECQRKSDGRAVAALCAIGWVDGEYAITPFAVMCDNAFEELLPPNPDGGFHDEPAMEAT